MAWTRGRRWVSTDEEPLDQKQSNTLTRFLKLPFSERVKILAEYDDKYEDMQKRLADFKAERVRLRNAHNEKTY